MTNAIASPRWKLTKADGIKVLKGLGIAVLGAALTYLTETIPNVELGEYTPIVVAGWSVIVNVLRKWLANA